DQLALRPIQHALERRLDHGERAASPLLQHIARNDRERCDLDPLQTHARSTSRERGPAFTVLTVLLAQFKPTARSPGCPMADGRRNWHVSGSNRQRISAEAAVVEAVCRYEDDDEVRLGAGGDSLVRRCSVGRGL